MALSGLQKTMIKTGVNQFHKYVMENKDGKIDFTLEEINEWLKNEDYPFIVKVRTSTLEENKVKTEVRIECKEKK